MSSPPVAAGTSTGPARPPARPASTRAATLPSADSARIERTRIQRTAKRMPAWMGSIRFRLAVVYSSVLFSLAAILVSVIYIAVAIQLNHEAVYQDRTITVVLTDPLTGQQEQAALSTLQEFERQVNARTLDQLRRFSFGALLALFLTSLVVGWFVAGGALAPVERITAVAREIQATDLKRRIDLGGPPDELRDLADTFDDMLDRIDGAFEEQRTFIHEASHELRNPLAVIRTNVDVALADTDADEADLRDALAVVQRSSERMTRLVDDLLVHARQGATVREMGTVDLGAIATEAAGEFRLPADARGITISVETEPDVRIVGDAVALKQALANLLANAVGLAPEGSELRVATGTADPAWAWIAVADQGPGIAPAEQERVFQRFYRSAQIRATTRRGSGLGLTIVRQIAEAHGGEVTLVSELGQGSTFTMWLPRPADRPDETTVTPTERGLSPRL